MVACWSPYPASVGFKYLLCTGAVGIFHGSGSTFGLLPSSHQSVSTIQSQPKKISVDFGGVKGTPHNLGCVNCPFCMISTPCRDSLLKAAPRFLLQRSQEIFHHVGYWSRWKSNLSVLSDVGLWKAKPLSLPPLPQSLLSNIPYFALLLGVQPK